MADEQERERRQREAIDRTRAAMQQRAEVSIVGAGDIPASDISGPPLPDDIQSRQQAAIDRVRPLTESAIYANERRSAFANAPEISRTGVRGIMTPPSDDAGLLERAGQGFQEFSTAAAGLTAFDPWEFGKILMEQDPNIGVVQSPEGEFFAVNRKTNKVVSINKPGASVTDALQLLGAVTSMAPAAGPVTWPVRAVVGGGLQTAIQAGQEAMGGEFNPLEVASEMAFSVAGDLIPAGYRATKNLFGRGAPVDTDMRGVIEEVGEAAISGQPTRLSRAAETVEADPQLVESAQRLGVEQDVPLSALSANDQFVAVQAGLTARLGSDLADDQADSVLALSENVARRLDEYGAAASRGGFDDRIRTSIQADIADLSEQSNYLYKALDKAVDRFGGKYQVIDTPILQSYTEQLAKAYPGSQAMPTGIRNVLNQVTDPNGITYEALDRLRRTTGEQYAAALRGSNPYPDTDVRSLGQLYDVITRQQNQALEGIVGDRAPEIWGAAKGLVQQRKQLEEISIRALGKDLSNDIMPKLEQSLANVARGNIKVFEDKINAIPEELRPQAMITALKSMMQKNARSSDVDKEFAMSLSYFPNWWRQVKSDSKVFGLVSEYLQPDQLRFFDDVARLGGSLQRSIQRQPMNGRIVEFVDNFDKPGGLVSRLFGGAKNRGGIIGLGGSVASSVFDLLTGAPSREDALNKISDLLRNKDFRRMVINGSEGSPISGAANDLLKSSEFESWYEGASESVKNGILELGRRATASLPNPSPERILSAGVADYFTRSNFEEIEQYFAED
jgi:hypothetical protein